MKIYINRRPYDGPWGGGNNFVKAMYEYLPQMGFDIILDPFKVIPDIIFLQSPRPDDICKFSINDAIKLKSINPKTKIIIRVNECDARKGTADVDSLWIECSRYIDKTAFVSEWMKNYFLKKGWHCKENFVLYNGVDLDHFKKREKINNGKINIVTHHWSNNRMKGFDIYEFIDEFVKINSNYTFTYIGRDLGTFKNSKIIDPLFGEALGIELSKYDIYISGSLFDPGPNHIIESVSCEMPTYAIENGGGAVEFVGKDNVYKDKNELEKILLSKNYKNNETYFYTWEECMKNYFYKMRE